MKTIQDVRSFLMGRIEAYEKMVQATKQSSIEGGKQALSLSISLIIEESYLEAAGKSLSNIYHAPPHSEAQKIRSYIRSTVDVVLMEQVCSMSGHSSRIHDTFYREGYRRFWEDFNNSFPEKL